MAAVNEQQYGITDIGNNMVRLSNGQTVDRNHPLYQQAIAGPVPASVQAPGLQPNANTPATGAAGGVNTQAINAQTYSSTPGAAPTANTTNQGTQDVVRNSYLQQATQGTNIDTNSPEFRQQVDPFRAAQERARRDYISQKAEQLSARGLGDSGALRQEERLAAERAGQATGLFESQLVGQELQNRRAEIQNALSRLGGMIDSDQGRALQQRLADIDAALRREGFATQTRLGQGDLDLRRQLGLGNLNLDALRLAQQGQQFNNDLGFRIGDREAYYNNQALLSLLG